MITDAEFIAAWRSSGGRAREVADRLGMSLRGTYKRRNTLEGQLGTHLPSAGDGGSIGRGDAGAPAYNYKPRLEINGFAGTAISFSDCHWWPGISDTVAYWALLEVVREIRPKLIVANGDILDGAQISRFSPIGWAKTPDVKAELDEVGMRMTAIRLAARHATHIRTIGNHDLRYDSTLASRAAQFTGIKGFRLADHLVEWRETMSLWINCHTVIKHRWNGGIHAAWNNVVRSGMSMITGHTHDLEVKPYGDYRGRRYAGQDGTLADPYGPQFAYAEDNPTRACAGFLVLNFDKGGRLLQPEMVEVIDGTAYFRGQRVVSARKKAA